MKGSSASDQLAKECEDVANVRPLEYVRVVKAYLNTLDEMLDVVKRVIDRHATRIGINRAVAIRQELEEGHRQVKQSLDLLEEFFSQQTSSS